MEWRVERGRTSDMKEIKQPNFSLLGRRIGWAFFMAVLLFSNLAWPKQPVKNNKIFFVKEPAKKKKPFKEPMVTVNQEADQLEYDDKKKVMHLTGHVKLTQGETILSADEATYYLDTEEAEALGSLTLTRPNGTLTGHHLHLYYREQRALFDRGVTLIHLPGKNSPVHENEIIDKNPVKITGWQLEYRWQEKVAVAQGNVELIQGDRKAYADHAVYSEPLDRLEMDGHVRLIRPPKDQLECDHLVYVLATNQAFAQGHVRGKFWVRQKPRSTSPSSKQGGTPVIVPAPAPTPSPSQSQPAGPLKP